MSRKKFYMFFIPMTLVAFFLVACLTEPRKKTMDITFKFPNLVANTNIPDHKKIFTEQTTRLQQSQEKGD